MLFSLRYVQRPNGPLTCLIRATFSFRFYLFSSSFVLIQLISVNNKNTLKRKPTSQKQRFSHSKKIHILDALRIEENTYERNFPYITNPKEQPYINQQNTKKTSHITPHIEQIPQIFIRDKTKLSSTGGELFRNKLKYTKATAV